MEALETEKKQWLGFFRHSPGGILYGAVALLQMLMSILSKLKLVAEEHADRFESEGFTTLFTVLKAELADQYFSRIKGHLKELKFHEGVLVSAQLGKGNEGTNYMLRKSMRKRPGWMQQLFGPKPPGYTFHSSDRDEAGARALSELQDRGINLVANALAQSADHVRSFFVMLRIELAFYLGCVNLHRQLEQNGVVVCFPVPAAPGARRHSCLGLCDVCLALSLGRNVVSNDLDGDEKNLVIITGANQGGKSTFMCGVGLAQLMMQCGMFVTANSFNADICRALLETRVKVFFVTHLYEFAHGLWDDRIESALFVRAEREADGRRTFKLLPGEPMQTSFGADLYEEIFNGSAELASRKSNPALVSHE